MNCKRLGLILALTALSVSTTGLAPAQQRQVQPAMQYGRPAQVAAPQTAYVEYDLWWKSPVLQAQRPGATVRNLTLDEAIVSALQNSSQIKVFSELPLIRRTAVCEAEASFDWQGFLESQWNDLSEPVGNSLTVGGGLDRFNDHQITLNGGFRRRTFSGGEFELAQQFGHQRTNSTFFVPNPQGTSRLTLSFTQPLMRGRGQSYNQSLICLAQIDKGVADQEFLRQLQSHLVEVSRAYWGLYMERGLFIQQFKSFHRAKEIVDRLASRQGIDVSGSQLKSAQASMIERRSDLFRAAAAIRNSEARLRALTNDPSLGIDDTTEIIPMSEPSMMGMQPMLTGSLGTALQHRPEVSAALKRIQAAAVRINMTKNELMPVLNLVTEGYVSGLKHNDIGPAFSQMFNEGEPSYTVGLFMEVPLGNRAARARHERRQIEHRQMQHEYQTALATIRLEVEVAVREMQTSAEEMSAKQAAVSARARQMAALRERWERIPGQNISTNLALENLLQAQERLTEAENEHLRSIMTYNLAVTALKRAEGTLLQEKNVSLNEYCECCLPVLKASGMAGFSSSSSFSQSTFQPQQTYSQPQSQVIQPQMIQPQMVPQQGQWATPSMTSPGETYVPQNQGGFMPPQQRPFGPATVPPAMDSNPQWQAVPGQDGQMQPAPILNSPPISIPPAQTPGLIRSIPPTQRISGSNRYSASPATNRRTQNPPGI